METNFFLLQETKGSRDAKHFWQRIVCHICCNTTLSEVFGRSSILYFDGRPVGHPEVFDLLDTLKSSSKKYTPREIRQMDYLLQYTSDIRHINEVENIPADALSHGISSFLLKPSIDIHTFSREQQKDEHYRRFLQKKNTAL